MTEALDLDTYDPSTWEQNPQSGVGSILRAHRPQAEVWFRSPYQYLNVLRDFPVSRFVFSRGDIERKMIRPLDLLSEVLPPVNFRWLMVAEDYAELQTRAAAEDGKEPRRLPLWRYGDDPELLLRLMSRAQAEDFERVVISGMPYRNGPEMNRVTSWLYKANCAYPEARTHHNYLHKFRFGFGLNFFSVDYNPAPDAAFDKIRLPNGQAATPGSLNRNLKWVHVLGFSRNQLKVYENRVAFNMAAALWAAENWLDPDAMAAKSARTRSDPMGLFDAQKLRTARSPVRSLLHNLVSSPDEFVQFSPEPEPYHLALPIKNAPLVPVSPRSADNGDKIICDRCSLAPTCRVYREGAICALTSSRTAELAEMFGTRDAAVVADALREVLSRQSERYQRAAQLYRDEDDSDVRDLRRGKHLLDMESSMMRNMETLIKVLDPSYRAQSPVPAVHGNITQIFNPQVLVADVVRELESQGVDRRSIDPQAIAKALQAQSQPAIEQ